MESGKKDRKNVWKEKDKKRKLYYQHYTGRDWGMAKKLSSLPGQQSHRN